MIRRNTWIVLAVFVLTVGFAWAFQKYGPGAQEAEATPTPTVEAKKMIDIEEKDIRGLQIADQQGQKVVIERDADGVWALSEPAAATDVSRVESMVNELAALTVLNTLETAPAATATGLDNPAYTLSLTLTNGTETIKVGGSTPTSSGYYVQVGTGPVVVVDQQSLDQVTGLLAEPPIQPNPAAMPTELGPAETAPAPLGTISFPTPSIPSATP